MKPLKVDKSGYSLVREGGDIRAFVLKYSSGTAADTTKSRSKEATFFAPNVAAGAATISALGVLTLAFRLRFDTVANALKPTKPFVLLRDTLTLKSGVPAQIC